MSPLLLDILLPSLISQSQIQGFQKRGTLITYFKSTEFQYDIDKFGQKERGAYLMVSSRSVVKHIGKDK